jgi:opacity protein-like surface antigen
MKKVLLLLVCISLAIGVDAQMRFGAKVGGTLSNFTVKSDGEKVDNFKSGIGFQIGGVLEYSFTESFALQPELLYVMHNLKRTPGEGVKMAYQVNDIQLPINLKYKMGVENLKFYAAAGPYFGYLVSATAKRTIAGETSSQDMFGNDSKMRHLDFGIGVGFGVELSKITVGVGYQYGIANLDGEDDSSIRLGTFNLSVGYFF